MDSGYEPSIDAAELEEIVEDVISSSGFSLVEMTLGGTPNRAVLRVYIYRPEGVGVDDCKRVSMELGAVLDEKELFPSSYVLEVSSPGAERSFRAKQEYEIFRGRQAKLEVDDEGGGSRSLIGTIGELEGDNVRLEVPGGEEILIPLSRIRKARLYVDWEQVSKGKFDAF